MNRSALTALVTDLANRSTNISVVYSNAWKHRKTSSIDRSIKFANLFGGKDIVKISHLTLGVGRDYEKVVNARLTKEGKEADFTAGSMSGVEWVSGLEGLLLVNGSGEEQLRTYADSGIVAENNKATYIWDDGREVTEEDWNLLQQFKNAEASEGEQGGLSEDHKVMPRNLFLSKILEAKAFGKVYR